jgi:hypothetical protein
MLLEIGNPIDTPYNIAEKMKWNRALSRIYLNELLLHFDKTYVLYLEKWSHFLAFIPTNW